MNNNYYELINKIQKCKQMYIYGAGIIAYGASEAIDKLYHREVSAYIVSDKNNNPDIYADTKVIGISEYADVMEKGDIVIVATPPEYFKDIENSLLNIGCEEYILISPELEYVLMGEYFKQFYEISCIEDLTYTTEIKLMDAKVYMAVSHNDRNLNAKYIEEKYVEKIQVGKANTDVVHSEVVLFDDFGENISKQNYLYGELTATYSIWKHYQHDILGLFHYRRILDVKEEQFALFNEGKIDVILPLPFVCYPDASGQYGRYVCEEDLNVMKDVIFEYYPELKEAVMDSLNSPILYNYNMLIARKEVFNDYCEWMFPLLEEITTRCEKVQRDRSSRYIGRIGEILSSLYFTINRKKWNITHAQKIWRV